MTRRERVERVYRLEPPDRAPFVPAIYEQKARLIGRTPSEICRHAELLSPRMFRELVLPVYRDQVVPELKAAGARYLPLIIGGDTTRILPELLATGATQLLCDAPADLRAFKRACATAGVPFRANVDARLIHRGPVEAIRSEAQRIAGQCRDFAGFRLGCGIVAYDCPPEHVLAVREGVG